MYYILCLMKKGALELFILSNRVNLCGEILSVRFSSVWDGASLEKRGKEK